MDDLTYRRLDFYIGRSYPTRVVLIGALFHATLPDLPGCEARGTSLPQVYQQLETRRHRWLTQHYCAGCPIPEPNDHLQPASHPRQSLNQRVEADRAHRP
jgi:predicted RNase H-like HicB family nuclease